MYLLWRMFCQKGRILRIERVKSWFGPRIKELTSRKTSFLLENSLQESFNRYYLLTPFCTLDSVIWRIGRKCSFDTWRSATIVIYTLFSDDERTSPHSWRQFKGTIFLNTIKSKIFFIFHIQFLKNLHQISSKSQFSRFSLIFYPFLFFSISINRFNNIPFQSFLYKYILFRVIKFGIFIVDTVNDFLIIKIENYQFDKLRLNY